MEYRMLGKTGLRVSALGFGCGNVGGLMIRGEPGDRVRAAARAMEAGVNYFDTAPSYGNGQSERNLGQVLKELKADVYVGTKVQIPAGDMGDLRGAIMRSVEASLARLGRESVDLIQLHNHIAHQRASAERTLSIQDVLEEVVAAFRALQAQGKTKYYGITALGETTALHQVIDSGGLYTAQVCFNLLNPSAGHAVPAGFPSQDFGQLIDRAARREMGCIGIRVLAAGALSGVEARHPVAVPSVAPIGTGPDYQTDVQRAKVLAFLVEQGYTENLIEASVRFAWSKEGISTVLVGFSSLEHLEQAITYAERGGLSSEALRRLGPAWERLAPAPTGSGLG
ncbi:MAG: aldo/keto reductase [Nitrospinae bacterium]|nr:aldo/keto reductase [Nitrospinota bacterium]